MYSHQVVTNAYIVFEEKFLLLKRIKSPQIWGPPGGHLHKNEDPRQGLHREIYEETGLTILVIQPVTTWFGVFHRNPLLSIDYLCRSDADVIHLSEEHSQFGWFSIDELYKKRIEFFRSEKGFQFADFLRARMIWLCLNGKLNQLNELINSDKLRQYLPIQK